MKSQYQQAAQAVRSWIAKQKLHPGSVLPSARLLGEQIGFSRVITGLACNVLVANEVLYRKGYKVFVSAGKPVRSPIQGIVYVVSYWPGFNRAAGRILTGQGVSNRPFLLSFNKHVNPLPALRKLFAEQPAGLLLWMPCWLENLESALKAEKIPMVISASGLSPETHLHSVDTDFFRSTELALRHLRDLGHRHIAHVSNSRPNAVEKELEDYYRKICRQLKLGSSASAIWRAPSRLPEEIRGTLLDKRMRHPEVTALYAEASISAEATRALRVPENISIVSYGKLDAPARIPLTTVGVTAALDAILLLACANLISQIQAIESGRPPIPPRRILLAPDLVVQKSTRALTMLERGLSARDMKAGRKHNPNVHDIDPARRGRHADDPFESLRKTYPFLKKCSAPDWRQINLSKAANHSMTREHGWLGAEPLLYFPPGLRLIHGVPFRVIDENHNDGLAVVTFLSPRTHTAGKKRLPADMRLTVDTRVKALYFLHACGWARSTQFAEYIMHFENGKTSTVPLVSLGPSPLPADMRQARLKPNIKDWWPLSDTRDFPHALHAVVFNPADPTEYARLLYTLEWINPRQQDEISHIEVRVDPEAGPALVLVAVTALLA